MKIGKIELKYPLVQAPLSGYSDLAMRTVSRDCGCELAFAGLMLDKSAAHPKVIKKPAFQPGTDEHPVGAQIHGNDPQIMADAAMKLEHAGYDIIDLNFACPARKVLLRGRGGSLMQDPKLVKDIYLAVRDAVKCPIGMKIRKGFDNTEQSTDNFWQICEDASSHGVDLLTIHGRTVEKRYSGKADWDIITQVKQRFPKMTVFGSGDLFEPKDCVEKLNKSGIDGLSIARGAIGNPWIFREIQAILDHRDLPPKPTIAQQGQLILKHVDMIFELFPERKTVGYFRKFIARYAIWHPRRKEAMADIIKTNSAQQLKDAIKRWYLI